MLVDSSPELTRGGIRTITELLDQKKICLRNFLGMFKVLKFLGFGVCGKLLPDFFVELIRGGTELSTELLDLKKKIPSKFFGYA